MHRTRSNVPQQRHIGSQEATAPDCEARAAGDKPEAVGGFMLKKSSCLKLIRSQKSPYMRSSSPVTIRMQTHSFVLINSSTYRVTWIALGLCTAVCNVTFTPGTNCPHIQYVGQSPWAAYCPLVQGYCPRATF